MLKCSLFLESLNFLSFFTVTGEVPHRCRTSDKKRNSILNMTWCSFDFSVPQIKSVCALQRPRSLATSSDKYKLTSDTSRRGSFQQFRV